MPAEIPSNSFLRDRDQEILHILTTKVPFLSLRQIADAFFASDIANAVRRLETLEENGLLVSYRLNARTPPEIGEPLAEWNPGQDQPKATRIAFQLTKRWLRQGTRMRLCYFAGKKFEAVTGILCGCKPTHLTQASHDLGLAAIYLHFRSERSKDAASWIGEKAYTCFEEKSQRPDAVLMDSSSNPLKVVEYGGVYNAKRLERFQRWCQRRSLPYEIW